MIKEYKDHPLRDLNSFHVEERADRIIEFDSKQDLDQIFAEGATPENWYTLGGGNNILFTQRFAGTLLKPVGKGIKIKAQIDDSVIVEAEAGVEWDDLVAWSVERDLWGMENLSLIPGEVGASAVQNVGAYGVEAGELIEKVETLRIADAKHTLFYSSDCRFAYRHSVFKAEEKGRHIITYVTYRLKKSSEFKLSYGNLKEKVEELGGATLANVRKAVCEIRQAKLPDPKEIGSAGSFFMNPVVGAAKAAELKETYPSMPQYVLADSSVKLSAGWLIEQCGWKDTPHSHVGVYRHQALVVVNLGGAKGTDVLAFAHAVVESVKEKFGVELAMEVNVIE